MRKLGVTFGLVVALALLLSFGSPAKAEIWDGVWTKIKFQNTTRIFAIEAGEETTVKIKLGGEAYVLTCCFDGLGAPIPSDCGGFECGSGLLEGGGIIVGDFDDDGDLDLLDVVGDFEVVTCGVDEDTAFWGLELADLDINPVNGIQTLSMFGVGNVKGSIVDADLRMRANSGNGGAAAFFADDVEGVDTPFELDLFGVGRKVDFKADVLFGDELADFLQRLVEDGLFLDLLDIPTCNAEVLPD